MDSSKVVMDYSSDFPKLPDAPPTTAPVAGVWNRQSGIQATEVTEAFKLTGNERASRGLGKQFGNVSEEQQKCNSVATATGTKIELCEAKDHSLTILITGKRSQVNEARNRLVRELQTQASVEVAIPKEYHGHIIGKEGSKLRSLENDYLCRIYMPGRDEKSDVIRIVGPNDYVGNAARKIREIGEEMSKQGNESISIPREFYPWIRGPFNETLDQLSAAAPSVKINIPPSNSRNEVIIITGLRQEVDYVAAEIRAIYAAKKACNKMLTCKVAKAQHRFIIGSKRSGIEEILRDTDVVVEVPPEEEESDLLTLRGPADRLGDALALVYSKASSVISQEIHYPEWMRRFLIGPKGSTLQQLVPNQEKLKIEFEDGGTIYLEGSPDVVKPAYSALSAEVARLQSEMSSESVKVPINLHRHIIGKSGASVNKMKEENGVQITIPNEKSNSDEIRIEGKKEGVKKTVAEIKEIVRRLENEKTRELVISNRLHGQIIGKSGENTNKWRKEFPTVSINFPESDKGKSAADKESSKTSDVVTLRGDKKEVDKLCGIMEKLSKELEESSYKQTVSIAKDYYKHIIGKSGVNINKIRDETQTRIDLPEKNSSSADEDNNQESVITVTGKQANVEKAIQKLKQIQEHAAEIQRQTEERKLRSFKVTLDVPIKYHQRIIGPGGSRVRQMAARHNKVQISIPRPADESETITISGFESDCANCKAEIEKLVAELEAMVSEEVKLDVRFHPRMIGAKGRNLRKLEDEFGVEIKMPSRDGPNPDIVVVSGKDENRVYDCVEKLRIMEEDYIADIIERDMHVVDHAPPREDLKLPQQVEITGAPWQLDSMEQFPAMGAATNGGNAFATDGQVTAPPPHQPAVVGAGVWGNRRW